MPDVPLSQFGIENVTKVYLSLKTNPLMEVAIGVSTTYGVAIVIARFFKEWKANMKAGADYTIVYDLFWQYFFTASLIAAAPFIIYAVEIVLGEMQMLGVQAAGGEVKGANATIGAEIDEMMLRYPKGPSFFFDTLPDIFAYFYIIYLKPALAIVVRWIYGVFLCGRYVYLLLLEVAYPVAFVSLLNEDQAPRFYTWLGNMFTCYLMVPAFLIANAFADGVVFTVFDDPYSFFGIMAQFILKLSLLGKATQYVFKLH